MRIGTILQLVRGTRGTRTGICWSGSFEGFGCAEEIAGFDEILPGIEGTLESVSYWNLRFGQLGLGVVEGCGEKSVNIPCSLFLRA